MKKLVIFDLDGTLLDTVEDLAAACNFVLDEQGYPIHHVDEYRLFVGNGISKLIERAIPKEKRTPANIEELRLKFIERYTSHADEQTRPYSGIPELIKHLDQSGIKLAVASNKFHDGATALVSRFFADVNFVAVFGQRTGIPQKPNPFVVEEIISLAKVTREETLYVGDTDVDMQTAVNSGVESVGVLWGFRGERELIESGADHIVHHPSDIIPIITFKA